MFNTTKYHNRTVNGCCHIPQEQQSADLLSIPPQFEAVADVCVHHEDSAERVPMMLLRPTLSYVSQAADARSLSWSYAEERGQKEGESMRLGQQRRKCSGSRC